MKNTKMRYPLPERIGDPDLLVGREKEFRLLGQWLDLIPKRLGKSRAILGRRKSGKTAIVQRIFNRVWSENRNVVPFYFSIREKKIWYPEFAIEYYRAFASQYISFLERDERLVRNPLSLDKIREYGISESPDILAEDVNMLLWNRERELHDSMWEIAYTAPERFAGVYDQRILVIIDEFQNITQYIYRDKACKEKPDETLAGSFHDVVESKIALTFLISGTGK
ncbi:hypothetical protein QUF80_06090 [Desulfococcaceae bacterium HSG8]|nr:hypothetical protein [Desulfococcaceae bacterium HSG8]